MEKRESAVSPVVGVMLMLAVTIMIAAIVSATAGNFSGTEKKAPSAILDVTIYAAKDYGGYYVPTMTIKHVSGNVLQTKDLQIVTYYTVPGSGNISRGSLMGVKTVDVKNSSGTEQYGVMFISDETRGSPETWFGNTTATFKPGDLLVTPAQYCENEDTDAANTKLHNNPAMVQLFPNVKFIKSVDSDANEFVQGGVVTVKIIHTPSGQIIFDKDVVIS